MPSYYKLWGSLGVPLSSKTVNRLSDINLELCRSGIARDLRFFQSSAVLLDGGLISSEHGPRPHYRIALTVRIAAQEQNKGLACLWE